jgi:hypothetical protein
LSDPARREYVEVLEKTSEVIDGFESPLGMELLGTVDWLIVRESAERTQESVRAKLSAWPGGRVAAARKTRLFDDRLVSRAVERLNHSVLASG